jgi:hypothetical protein
VIKSRNTWHLTGEKGKPYTVLVGKLEGRSRRKWLDTGNIKMHLKEKGWQTVNWTHLDKDRVKWLPGVNTVMNLRVPYKKTSQKLFQASAAMLMKSALFCVITQRRMVILY